MKKIYLLLSLLLVQLISAQTQHIVQPSQTSASINNPNNNHFAYINTSVTAKNKLFLFFPGTGAVPFNYLEMIKNAANLGYHAIGLTYPNALLINNICATSIDTTCHSNARYEVFDGVDRTPSLNIDSNNCIQNRTIKLLQYLHAQFPTENWNQYYTGNTILWSKIIVSGHSQGGGHAGFISKIKSVDRVVMFSALDWIPLLNRNADWITWNGPTPSNKYFGFVHDSDELVNFSQIQTTWQNYGMSTYGPLVLTDVNATPYSNTHQLHTLLAPANDPTKFHGCVATDAYTPMTLAGVPVFKPVWDYMINSPISVNVKSIKTTHIVNRVAPSPFKDKIEITTEAENFKWVLYNVLGKEVLHGSNQKDIDTKQLSSGVFILMVNAGAQKQTFKLIKE
jgi:Secretion system C-terminal sorting domain